jgi:hypothetical protein
MPATVPWHSRASVALWSCFILVVSVSVVVSVLVASTAAADEPLGTVDAPATAERAATAVDQPAADLVAVYERNTLSTGVRDRTVAAAAAVGDPATVTRGFTVGLQAVRRGGTAVLQASGPGGGTWQFPLSVTAMPSDAIAAIMGRTVSAPIGAGQLVISATTATMHGAQVGDTFDLVAASGALLSFTVGMVASDDTTGGSEILMSTDEANALGATIDTGVLIYGQLDHGALDNSLGHAGLLSDVTIRVRHSWDPQDPDSTLGLAATKQLLGEFSYRIGASGAISVDPTWQAKYIPAQREVYAAIGVRAACNVVVRGDLQAALVDVANAGLGGDIDLADTNSAGGCFGPRFNRLSGNLGILSRHTWGQPIDMNTLENCQGCVPTMNCTIVRIFRSHGFAWGGNFLLPDGMHFEWTGRKTDQLAFPSRYCPNPVIPSTQAVAVPAPRSTFFDGSSDVWVGQGDA